MPRLHVVDPTTESGPAVDLLNGPLKNRQINIFKGFANNADVFKAALDFSKGIRTELSPAEHEVIALVCAERNHCEYCLAAHTTAAKRFQIDEEESARIRRGKVDDEKRQALIDFVTAIMETNGYISDEQLDAFRSAGYDDPAVVEVIAAIAYNYFTNLFNHVNQTEIDFPVPAQV